MPQGNYSDSGKCVAVVVDKRDWGGSAEQGCFAHSEEGRFLYFLRVTELAD